MNLPNLLQESVGFSFMTTADACVATTVADCVLKGVRLETDKDVSWEKLWYSTGISNPLTRIMVSPIRPLNLVTAVARFAWMIGGNNRVEDIAFYEPKVRGFSDDGLTVPGSDYGLRLVQPRPGLNQIEGVIRRLKEEPFSRQAASVVWQPEDAVRESSDIPCTFGLFFHVRDGALHMSVNMRSNNAFRILPFNIFEFTMLQEIVATELGLPVGLYHIWAASMHVYENKHEWDLTAKLANTVRSGTVPAPIFMAPMPLEFSALGQAQLLARYEAGLRHSCTPQEHFDMLDAASVEMHPYWHGLLGILACWMQAKRGWTMDLLTVPEPYRNIIESNIEYMLEKEGKR